METSYKKILKQQYKESYNWTEQLAHIIKLLFWAIGTWVFMSTVLTGFVCIFAVLTWDVSDTYNLTELQDGFAFLVRIISLVSAFVILVFSLPIKFRNVFHEAALWRVQRNNDLKKALDDHQKITDAVLLDYGLVTQTQIKDRHEKSIEHSV